MTQGGSPWPMRAIGELAADEPNSITDGPFGSKLKTSHYTESGPRVIRLANIGDGHFIDAKAHISEAHFATLQKHQVFPGDLVIAALGEDPPRSCIVPESLGPAIVKADCVRFKPGPDLLPKFANYALNSDFTRQRLRWIVHGVGRPRLNLKEIKAIEIPVPPPGEQQRVVAEIEKQFTRLDAAVRALNRLQRSLQSYRAAILNAACEGRLVPTDASLSINRCAQPETGRSLLNHVTNGRARLARWCETAVLPDRTSPVFLPDGWALASIDQLTYHLTSGSRDWTQYYGRGTATFILAKNVRPMRLDLTERQRVAPPAGEAETERTRVAIHDILVTIVGARTGDICRVRHNESDQFVSQSVALLRPVLSNCSAFMEIYLTSPHDGQRHWRRYMYGQGRPHLSFEQLRMTPIPLPPLAEQHRIVAEVERRWSVIDEIEAFVAENLQRATRLRQSILERAFSGRLIKSNVTEESVAETKEMSPASRRHFLRALLSAEIVHQLHAEPTFGQIKHQKIFHLCEHIAEITDLDVQYHRDAAGPYDNQLVYTNEAELKRQKWYESYSRKKVGRAYRPLAKAGGHEKYLERYWPEKLETIRYLIRLMRRWDTERCEIFSTAYAAWNDLLIWGEEASDDAIVHEVLHRWHESKQRISEERWRKALAWMRKKGFVPTGFGKPTAAARS